MQKMMNIWIDLDNSPHVPFFVPIIRELRRKGHSVTITARDCFQTCDLIELSGLEYTKIGRHYGRQIILKACGLLIRGFQLYLFARKKNFVLALSHGSRSLFIAAFLLKIPLVNMFDYEYSKFGLLPDARTKQLVPELLPDDILARQINLATVVKYPGLKEEIYIKDFQPDKSFLEKLAIDSSKALIIIRPPAEEAHYHNPESDDLLAAVLDYVLNKSNVILIVLPRTDKQKKHILNLATKKFPAQVIIPSDVVNGLDLIWHSDLVISGGGTMNREAAVLGVPAYSVFRGKTPAIDKFLEKEGKLRFIKNLSDVKKIKVTKRNHLNIPQLKNDSPLRFIINEIVKTTEDR